MINGGPASAPEPGLKPLPYHLELRDYLKSQERSLWDWFASARAREDYTETLRMGLLKSTYRLEPETHPDLYQALETVKTRLHLDIPVTVYQAQSSPQPNATLYFIPGEGHIVFSGPALSLLNHEELKSVLGHELAHYHLWQCEGGELLVADRLLQAVVNDPRSAPSHEQTARRFQLYTEIFADRGSLVVVDDLNTVVGGLVKMETGLGQVSGAGYLKQAQEIFAKNTVTTEGVSHPENFIRARALALWQQQGEQATTSIAAMIEGSPDLEDLDLIRQKRMMESTRLLIEQLLRPKWFQTPAVLGHAKMFFPDFAPASAADPATFDQLKFTEDRLREYVCYLLLDFVTADRDLDDMPLAHALDFSSKLELDTQFEKLVAKELKWKLRDLRKLKDQAATMLATAEVTP